MGHLPLKINQLSLPDPFATLPRSNAQFYMGLLYRSAEGVPQDYVQAHMWYDLTVAQGDSFARYCRDEIAKQMTTSQIAEAQRVAREWKPKSQTRK